MTDWYWVSKETEGKIMFSYDIANLIISLFEVEFVMNTN